MRNLRHSLGRGKGSRIGDEPVEVVVARRLAGQLKRPQPTHRRPPGAPPGPRRWNGQTGLCRWCGGEYPVKTTRAGGGFCSPKHRTAAWRAGRAAAPRNDAPVELDPMDVDPVDVPEPVEPEGADTEAEDRDRDTARLEERARAAVDPEYRDWLRQRGRL